MGASTVFETFEVESVRELRHLFRKRQEEDAYHLGHSYSGGLNMCEGLSIYNTHFNTENEAYEYLEERADKWGDALAARYGNRTEKGKDRWLVLGVCAS